MKLSRPDFMADVMEYFTGSPLLLEVEVSRSNATVVWRLDGREVNELINLFIKWTVHINEQNVQMCQN